MLAQVEVGTRMDTLHFLESERHLKFDIGSGIGIMGQFLMIVETIIFSTETKSLMPFHTDFLPFREPFHLCTRFNEELHRHLFKLAHTEDELTGYNLITESLAYLSDSKRYLHTACFLYIQVIDKNSLSCLRTQINLICRIGSRTHLCREHQIKLTHVGPVFGTTDRVYDSFIQYNLLEFFQIRSLHSSCITFVQGITMYSKEDKEIGYIVSKDRFGTTRNFNLLSVSCSIIEINSQSNILNFDDTLNSMKKESKSSKEPVYKVL